MEAMSVERLLLAAWEEEGFIGKTRVPIGSSDVDVLAVNVNTRTVRLGESKVREGSQRVYVIDDWCAAEMSRPGTDFRLWLDEGWQQWLNNLSRPWDHTGTPVVPWLPPVKQVKAIEVVFCCNLHLFTDRQAQIHAALSRTVTDALGTNPALAGRLEAGLKVRGRVQSTLEVACDLTALVCRRIDEEGYGRRFGDPFKDLVRELHRFLRPELYRLPRNDRGESVGSRKSGFEENLRKQAVLKLLAALGVDPQEVCRWVGTPD